MEVKAHWERIFTLKDSSQLSWYQPHLQTSLRLIDQAGIGSGAQVIDVGSGTSTLVDDLLTRGFLPTVLDISSTALKKTQERLGTLADTVHWIEADVTQVMLPPNAYDIWHDRAVFHFLTDAEDRRRYVERVRHALKPEGHIILATFSLDGPTQCSGLDVIRYDAGSLRNEFGTAFELVESVREAHQTPFGTQQAFIYCYCRKR